MVQNASVSLIFVDLSKTALELNFSDSKLPPQLSLKGFFGSPSIIYNKEGVSPILLRPDNIV